MALSHLYPWQILTRNAGLDLVHQFDRIFDAERMAAELHAILREYEVQPHYRPYLANGWGAITLKGPNGDPNDHRPMQAFKKGAVQNLKTPVCRLAPYMESIIDSFDCNTRRVRLMRLAPGKQVFWHHDGLEYGIDKDCVRLHIPVVTNDKVVMQVCHEDCQWRPGELWFLDNSFPHRLHNGGTEARVHFVIDLDVDSRVQDLFPAALRAQTELRERMRPKTWFLYDNTTGRLRKVRRHFARRRQQTASAA